MYNQLLIKQISIVLFFFFALCSCTKTHLERALYLAGENRPELDSVLQHYANEPLKLKAAEFLIENMIAHYSFDEKGQLLLYYNEIDSLHEVTQQLPRNKRKQLYDSIASKYDTIALRRVSDLEIVSAQFLIDNIDRSFSLWQQESWATHLGFDDFCEYILPYRVIDGQTLDNWKEYAYEECRGDIDSLHFCDLYKNLAYKACEVVNSGLKKKLNPTINTQSKHVAVKRVQTSLKVPEGVCDDYSFIATAIMRAKGIPVAIDYTPQWPFRKLGHAWNVLLDNFGKNIVFVGCETKPGLPHKVDQKMAKVFRRSYAMNRELNDLLQKEKCIHPSLSDLCLKDVTNEYMKTHDVNIKLKDKTAHQYAYLTVFDNQEWVPVYWGRIRGNKVTFERMGANIVYLPVCYEGNKIIPIAPPFLLTHSGEKKDIVPDEEGVQTLEVYRKYFFPQHAFSFYKRTIGAKIQVSNYPDFRDSVTLFTIQDLGINTGRITFSENEKYQYWRYLSPDKANCNIAELYFFEKDSVQPTYGDIIGTEGSYRNNGRGRERAFDKNPLTSFDSPPVSGTWVGMDFGQAVEIEKILYIPRGDGNSIVFGNEYELVYWGNGHWNSLGKQVAENNFLKFENCPKEALFLLHNLTEGYEERIFTYENKEQVWW